MNVKVFILTEGGKNIGFGHITRCTSIYEAFDEIDIPPQFIVNGDGNVENLLKGKKFRVFDWLNDQKTLFATVRNADIVFIDSYLADYALYEKISNIVKTAVYFDDDIRIEYPGGTVLNGTVFAEQMPYPKRKNVTYLLGSKYAPLRKEFWNTPEKPIRDNLQIAMVTFGGMDIRNLTPKVLKLLNSTYPELLKEVIIGKGFKNITEIEKFKDNNTELIYYPNATEMENVMLESDIAISACGQTLYELASVGVPTIGLTVADNQLPNTKGWQKTGFIEYAGYWDHPNVLESINFSINKLKDSGLRKNKARVGMKFIDGKGAFRIAKFFVKKLSAKEY